MTWPTLSITPQAWQAHLHSRDLALHWNVHQSKTIAHLPRSFSRKSKDGTNATTPCGETRHTFTRTPPHSSSTSCVSRNACVSRIRRPRGPTPSPTASTLSGGTTWPHWNTRKRASASTPPQSCAVSSSSGVRVPLVSTTERAAASRPPNLLLASRRTYLAFAEAPRPLTMTQPEALQLESSRRNCRNVCRAAAAAARPEGPAVLPALCLACRILCTAGSVVRKMRKGAACVCQWTRPQWV
jgi:hypothetical protein